MTAMLSRNEAIDLLMAHYEHPANYGALPAADVVYTARTPGCGDEITLYIQLDAAGERVARVQFEGHGCTVSQAMASLLSERIVGVPVARLATLSVVDLCPELERGVLMSRIRCASLPLRGLQAALHTPTQAADGGEQASGRLAAAS